MVTLRRSPDRFPAPPGPPPGRRGAARLLASLLCAALVLALPTGAAAKDVMHKVRKGQTLGGIARRYGVPVDAILAANGLGRRDPITPGQVLLVPDKRKAAKLKKRAADAKKEEAKERRKKRVADDEANPRGKKLRDDGGKTAAKPDGKSFVKRPKRPGMVALVRGGESAKIRVLTSKGRLVAASLPKLSKILRFFPTGAKKNIDPRLATLLGMVSDHFGGRTIRIVSGFRPYTPGQHTEQSNHNHGRAVDFSVDGVPNTVVRDYCRTFRNAGVGFYPRSSFIHLDVRKGKAYWVDYSGPGEAPQYHLPRPADEPAPPSGEAFHEEAFAEPAPSEKPISEEPKDPESGAEEPRPKDSE